MLGLSGPRCAQLRAVVRRSAADDGDDSAAYWPVTLLSAVIAPLTDTDHPLSSGPSAFIKLLTYFFQPAIFRPEAGKKKYEEKKKLYIYIRIHTQNAEYAQ